MGKRVKKKSRALQKEKQAVASSPKAALDNVDTVSDNVTIPKERTPCSHIDNGFNLNNFSEKLGSSDSFRCEDCGQGKSDRRGGGAKGKGKHGKKKGGASIDSKSDKKAIWICLECGHYGCGGIGLPTTSQSHAVRHARQARHPLVIQLENPLLRWCFQCNMQIPVEKLEENSEKKDALLDVVKLLKTGSSEKSSADVEDVWFGGSSVVTEIKAQGTILSSLEGNGGYLVRGLVNLGNTCFFNSVMQNLLSMDKLRDYFFNHDAIFGSLSNALKNLFIETKPDNSLKSAINPRPLFSCVCSKAPQFRGYQQQDSHELLRCLLDGLSTEELIGRKNRNASAEHGFSQKQTPTFIEATFGGQISSTVCCVECGHSSTVYEPYLDLSLPVPTKRPPAKIVQPASRAKKAKPAPKKSGRARSKVNKSTDSVVAESTSNPPSSSFPSCQTESTAPVAENMVASSVDATVLDCTVSANLANESGLASKDFSANSKSENEQVIEQAAEVPKTASISNDEMSWMDFLGPGTSRDVSANSKSENKQVIEQVAGEHKTTSIVNFETSWMDYLDPGTTYDENFTSENNNVSIAPNSGDKFIFPNDGSMTSSQELSFDALANQKPDSSSANPLEEEAPLQVQDSVVLLLPYKEESFSNGEMTKEAEVSSSVGDCKQDDVEFDGVGDLFAEPEVSEGPVMGPSLGPENAESSFMAGNVSESDPDEVDNTNAPVSVESCLLHFIKPELLCDDNAWECENCSKIQQRQKLEAKKRWVKTTSGALMNGGETQIRSELPSLDKETGCLNEVKNLNNGHCSIDPCVNSTSEIFVSNNGKVDCSNQNCVKSGEPELYVSQPEEQRGEPITTPIEQSHCSNSHELCNQESPSALVVDSSCTKEPNGTGRNCSEDQRSGFQSSETCEPGENEFQEKSPKKLKVKRDATKRVLIDRAPPILTIHLKRFSQDARGRLSKLNGHVNFRDTIDLGPYMDSRCVDKERYVYRLVGVVEHSGTMRGGHYEAYVRGSQRRKGKTEQENGSSSVWYRASDAYVCEVTLEEVLRCEAYILFYEKM